MKLPAADGEFDAVYEIEATCHAPDIRGVYACVPGPPGPAHQRPAADCPRPVTYLTAGL